jgi:hypothetical protein
MGYTWQYYDLVLAGIFLSMASGGAVGLLTSIPLNVSVLAFGVVAALLIGHGLFVNGPVDDVEDLTEEVETLNELEEEIEVLG